MSFKILRKEIQDHFQIRVAGPHVLTCWWAEAGISIRQEPACTTELFQHQPVQLCYRVCVTRAWGHVHTTMLEAVRGVVVVNANKGLIIKSGAPLYLGPFGHA